MDDNQEMPMFYDSRRPWGDNVEAWAYAAMLLQRGINYVDLGEEMGTSYEAARQKMIAGRDKDAIDLAIGRITARKHKATPGHASCNDADCELFTVLGFDSHGVQARTGAMNDWRKELGPLQRAELTTESIDPLKYVAYCHTCSDTQYIEGLEVMPKMKTKLGFLLACGHIQKPGAQAKLYERIKRELGIEEPGPRPGGRAERKALAEKNAARRTHQERTP